MLVTRSRVAGGACPPRSEFPPQHPRQHPPPGMGSGAQVSPLPRGQGRVLPGPRPRYCPICARRSGRRRAASSLCCAGDPRCSDGQGRPLENRHARLGGAGMWADAWWGVSICSQEAPRFSDVRYETCPVTGRGAQEFDAHLGSLHQPKHRGKIRSRGSVTNRLLQGWQVSIQTSGANAPVSHHKHTPWGPGAVWGPPAAPRRAPLQPV